MLASHLVEDLLQATMSTDMTYGGIELDDIENLYITDEETAKDYGWGSLEAMQDAGEDQQEVFEWWFVSSWLYKQLKTEGKPVVDSAYGYIWGRTCTGQAISLDSVIERIYNRL